MFLCFINHSTLTTDQRIQATFMQNLFQIVLTVREEEAPWSGRLPCAFFQSLPSGIPLPQPIIMIPYSIHQNSPSALCECNFSLYYRILIQGGKTHPPIFILGTNNFIEYLQSCQILIFIYYKFYFIMFIIIQYTVYVVGTLAAI